MTERNATAEALARQKEQRESQPTAKPKPIKAAKDNAPKKDRTKEGNKLTVRKDILQRLRYLAAERGLTMKALAEQILDRYLPCYKLERVEKTAVTELIEPDVDSSIDDVAA
jgi:hypothetical protein